MRNPLLSGRLKPYHFCYSGGIRENRIVWNPENAIAETLKEFGSSNVVFLSVGVYLTLSFNYEIRRDKKIHRITMNLKL